jgi:aspartate aminotransferase-like enzyme
MNEKEYISLVPGPSHIYPRVLKAMSNQIGTHLHNYWQDYYLNTCDKVKRLFQTQGDVFLMASSGTGAVEAAISSVICPGGTFLVLSNGLFGDRLAMIAKTHSINVVTINFPTNESIDPEKLVSLFKEKGNIFEAVGMVYCESQNGILNPVKDIAKICNSFDVPLIVDAISAIGGVEFRMDEWGIDIAVCAAQKCLSAPVGMSMVAVREKAWAHFENKNGSSLYFNLNIWRDSIKRNPIHPHPWSMSETLVFGVSEALDIILEEGLENVWRRHKTLYHYYVQELKELGFSMFVPEKHASPTVISVESHPHISIDELKEILKNKFGILIGVGIYQQAGKIWRIGNMGYQANINTATTLIQALKSLFVL